MTQQSKSLGERGCYGVLYIVATPIGNLSDMSFRAVETLKHASVIACEDTRVSRVLMSHYGITAPLIAYHDHNAQTALPQLLSHLEQGESVALISDAGTPLISDPGYRLVTSVIEAGGKVVPIPGASSVITALCASGLPTDRVHFSGFLPSKSLARKQELERLATIDATLVLFESNHRIVESLSDACMVLGGGRIAVIAREITKHFEEFKRGTLQEILDHYASQAVVKGEIVLLIAPPLTVAPKVEHCRALLEALLIHYPVKSAATLLANVTGLPRKEFYDMALSLKSEY